MSKEEHPGRWPVAIAKDIRGGRVAPVEPLFEDVATAADYILLLEQQRDEAREENAHLCYEIDRLKGLV